MFFRKLLRLVGILLVIVGLGVFLYAGVNYFQTSQAEKLAEARVPDVANAPKALPTLAPPTATEAPTEAPTDIPTATPQPTTPAPTPTPTTQMVVGSQGLPKGLGASSTRMVIPRMAFDAKVEEAGWATTTDPATGEEVSDWQIPYQSVGHLKTTAEPGEAGNAVISGHNNLVAPNVFGVGMFAGLWNLQVGDPIYITDSAGRTFLYQVSSFYHVQELGMPDSVREQHYQEMLADDGTPQLTLETCWNGPARPLSGNTYRWVVRAKLIGTVDGSQIPNVKGD